MKAKDSDAELLVCYTVGAECFLFVWVFLKNLEKAQANLGKDSTKHQHKNDICLYKVFK